MTKCARKLLLVAASLAMLGNSAPPAGGPPKAFTLPAHETYSLPNGLMVTLVPYGNIPKVALTLALRAGSINEPKAQIGVANLTAELLKEGTTTLSAAALAEAAAKMGSSIRVAVTPDETSVSLDVLSESAPDAIKLIADLVEHPLLPEAELARLKLNELRRIAVAKSQPDQIALARFRKLLYGEHGYGEVLPTDESINKMTLDDVKTFLSANYGAGRAHLYVAGKFDAAAGKKAIADSFSGWAKGAPAVENVPQPKGQRVVDVTDRPGAPQSTLFVGLPAPPPNHPDSIRLGVTNTLLGGSFMSRITSNIREHKGYTYTPVSQVSNRYHDAYWVEVADVTTQFTGASLKEIFGEIDRLRKEPPGAAELQRIQSYLSGVFVIRNSTRQALITQLRFVDLQGLGEDYLKTYVQKVNSVTPSEVQATTGRYIKPEQMTIVVVGDKAKITEQLAPFTSGGAQ